MTNPILSIIRFYLTELKKNGYKFIVLSFGVHNIDLCGG